MTETHRDRKLFKDWGRHPPMFVKKRPIKLLMVEGMRNFFSPE